MVAQALNSQAASQVSRAVFRLREMLLWGEIRPGARISEIPLAAKLGVSRTPLRLAMERLAHQGLIESLPNGGFSAREFTPGDIWDAIETRGVLEGTAARLAAERLVNPVTLEPLSSLNREIGEIIRMDSEGFGRYLELNEAFHSAVIDLASSRMLRRAVENVYSLPFAAPSALLLLDRNLPEGKEMIAVALEHHRTLVDAIGHREGARAEAIAREHSRLARRNLELALSDRNILETIPGAPLLRVSRPLQTGRPARAKTAAGSPGPTLDPLSAF